MDKDKRDENNDIYFVIFEKISSAVSHSVSRIYLKDETRER